MLHPSGYALSIEYFLLLIILYKLNELGKMTGIRFTVVFFNTSFAPEIASYLFLLIKIVIKQTTCRAC